MAALRGRWLRRSILAISGIAWFIWLGVEDQSVYYVLALAVLAALDALFILPIGDWVSDDSGNTRPLLVVLIGLAIGACVPVVAALLMLVKVSLHSHSQPDFSLEQVLAILQTMPVWALAAGLLAAGWLIWPKSNE